MKYLIPLLLLFSCTVQDPIFYTFDAEILPAEGNQELGVKIYLETDIYAEVEIFADGYLLHTFVRLPTDCGSAWIRSTYLECGMKIEFNVILKGATYPQDPLRIEC